ncbi:MAG: HAMP domain-containing histidine kinase [Gammaproteobacteria bacterium]|nr:HAMP domain-containing histidine kinase [Gammaproteobacteria bacterium]MBL7000909.1 HAMP domain-containing histidine kinase [Gammaproteobacteria bacterium]
MLRNIMLLFLLALMFVALWLLDIQLPVWPLAAIMLILASTNLVTRIFIYKGREITDQLLFIQLLVDILCFSLVLYFTGGATNPITFFYLIPLAIAATVIPGRLTWLLTAVTVILYSLLLQYYVPLTYRGHEHHTMTGEGHFNQHVLGMWFGFLVSAMLVTWFITFLAKELKQRNQDIADARQRELRDQQMISLGTLAAGTAHELGTPLASLAIITGELTDGYDPLQHPELFENQKILRDQIKRCKKILAVLSDSAGDSRADSGHSMELSEFLQLIMQQWQAQYPKASAVTRFQLPPDGAKLLYDRIISQALLNLLNNAADAATAAIEVEANVEQPFLQIKILDNGSGITDEQIAMAGQVSFSSKPGGLGIGLYLAITTIRRSGGNVSFNRLDTGGSCTLVQLPLL